MDAKSSLACALHGKPCKQPVRMLEVIRFRAPACYISIPEGSKWKGRPPKPLYWLASGPVNPEDHGKWAWIENKLPAKGEPPQPLCEGCPARNDPKQPIRSLTVVLNYGELGEASYGGEVDH